MNRKYWIPLTLAAGFATALPSRASADVVLPERQCVQTFLSACATLHFVDFGSDGVLTVIVSNTSTALEPNAYIHRLLFDLIGTVPELADPLAFAEYGTATGDGSDFTATGDTEFWNVKKTDGTKTKGGVSFDLEMHDHTKVDKGGRPLRYAEPGEAVRITMVFTGSLEALSLGCDDPVNCQAWTAEMKGLGPDQTGHDYTTTIAPEPATVVLLASGLGGLFGVGAARRRRRKKPSA